MVRRTAVSVHQQASGHATRSRPRGKTGRASSAVVALPAVRSAHLDLADLIAQAARDDHARLVLSDALEERGEQLTVAISTGGDNPAEQKIGTQDLDVAEILRGQFAS